MVVFVAESQTVLAPFLHERSIHKPLVFMVVFANYSVNTARIIEELGFQIRSINIAPMVVNNWLLWRHSPPHLLEKLTRKIGLTQNFLDVIGSLVQKLFLPPLTAIYGLQLFLTSYLRP